jgi:hypothetical protein
MPVWPTSRIRQAVIQALVECGGAKPSDVRDGNTVGDFWPGDPELQPSRKAQITRRIKVNCDLEMFTWPGSLRVTIGDLIALVSVYQRI